MQTSILLDSVVTRLHYKTSTQSGLTNNAEEFKYKQGKTVITNTFANSIIMQTVFLTQTLLKPLLILKLKVGFQG